MTLVTLDLRTYIKKEHIFFLEERSKEETIRRMITNLSEEGALTDKDLFIKRVLEREAVVSTGIGVNIALPHAKLGSLEDFFVGIGVVKEKGIEWDSIDMMPVKLIFLIGGPEHLTSEYLQLLSQITRLVKEEEFREQLFKAEAREDVVKIFQTCYSYLD